MNRYPILLLDADNTLFNFDAGNRRAFTAVCRACHLPDTDALFHAYEAVNAEMWGAFDRGEYSKDFIVVERFRLFLERCGLQADPVRCNAVHLDSLKTNTQLMPDALEVCRTLAQTHRLYIVTNAVAAVQKARLAASDIRPYITDALSPRMPGPASPPAPISTTFSRAFRALPGKTACSSATPPPATCRAPTTTASPAAGTIPTVSPGPMDCASTMRFVIWRSCCLL